MKGDFHVRFLERLGLKCPCLLDCCGLACAKDHQQAHWRGLVGASSANTNKGVEGILAQFLIQIVSRFCIPIFIKIPYGAALVGVVSWHARRITNKHTGCALSRGGLVGVSARILRKHQQGRGLPNQRKVKRISKACLLNIDQES